MTVYNNVKCKFEKKLGAKMSDKNISDLNDDELRLVMGHIPTEWDRIQFAQLIGRDDIDPQRDRKMFMREMRDKGLSRSEKFELFLHFLQDVWPKQTNKPLLQPVHQQGSEPHGSKIVRLKVAESYSELHEIMLEPISGALQGTPQQQMLNFMHLFVALSALRVLFSNRTFWSFEFWFTKKTPVPYNDPAWSSGSNLKAEYTYRLNIDLSGRISFEFNIEYSDGDFGLGKPRPRDKYNSIAYQINPDDAKTFEDVVYPKIRTEWRKRRLRAPVTEFLHTITKMLADDIKADKWTLHMPRNTDSEAFAKQITQIIVDSKLIFTEEYRPSGGAAGGGGMLLAPFLDRTLLQ
jgi:hypothetical protein